MTNPNRTHLTVVVDRTGSMHSLAEEATASVRNFIKEQAEQPGDCDLLFADFDSQEPFRTVYDGPCRDFDIATWRLAPRNMTPLHDAIGMGITRTGQRLAEMAEDDRPGHVIFVVVTDGGENSSREYDLPTVTEMIKNHEDQWKWTFVFLATGLDAFNASQAYVGTQMVGHTTRSAATGQAYGQTMSFASAAVAATRAGDEDVNYSATVDEDGNVTEGTTTS
jgi:hypothetical protein